MSSETGKMDMNEIIQNANIGRSRRDAQIDTCSVFAAALYDVLLRHGTRCRMVTAIRTGFSPWAHAVVEVEGRYYDSMGEFSLEIYRNRAKIHPKVEIVIKYKTDRRLDCYEQDFDELHAFYVKMLGKSFHKTSRLAEVSVPATEVQLRMNEGAVPHVSEGVRGERKGKIDDMAPAVPQKRKTACAMC